VPRIPCIRIEPSMLKDPGPGIPTCQMRDACHVGARHKPRRVASRAVELLDPIQACECWIWAARPQKLSGGRRAAEDDLCLRTRECAQMCTRVAENGRLGADRRSSVKAARAREIWLHICLGVICAPDWHVLIQGDA
jgi:hypothetical protein